MRRAIRKYARDFTAIVVLVVLSLVMAGYILAHQRLTLPGWVPVLGKDAYALKADFTTAQALTPGQGQTVNIAGVAVGSIDRVDLEGGRAVVSMSLDKKYDGRIHPDATMLLRPKSGLKDMTIELNPGTAKGGPPLPSGATIPISQTKPDVNLDEVLSALDADTRNYLQLLVNGAGTGLHDNGQNLSAVFKRLNPLARDLRQINSLVARRRVNVSRVIHNFQVLATALGRKDTQLTGFVDSSNAVFRNLAAQDQNIRQTVALLPGTLGATRSALGKTDALARQLGPALGSLRPAARALAPAQRATRPFLRESTPIVRDQLRPFARQSLPTVRLLRPAADGLAGATPNLTSSFKVVNYLLNELAYNPPGAADEGFLFWNAWTAHNGNSIFSVQDANGSIRRGQLIVSCSSIKNSLEVFAGVVKQINTLLALSNFPFQECDRRKPAGG